MLFLLLFGFPVISSLLLVKQVFPNLPIPGNKHTNGSIVQSTLVMRMQGRVRVLIGQFCVNLVCLFPGITEFGNTCLTRRLDMINLKIIPKNLE